MSNQWIVTRGLGMSPASAKYIVTHGFSTSIPDPRDITIRGSVGNAHTIRGTVGNAISIRGSV